MPADGLPVQIIELAPPFRFLTFAGRDRPERPVAVGGEQRAVQTHYPGSSRASVQVMGTREDPIVLRGWFWDELSILDGGPEARVAVLRGLMQGQSCQLIWGTTIVRTGRVGRCNFEFHRDRRIRYEVTFEVDAANEAVALVPLPLVASVAQDLKAGIDAALAAMNTAVEQVDTVKTLGAVVL